MSSNEYSWGQGIIMVDKFYGENLNHYKFQLEMVLATKDFC